MQRGRRAMRDEVRWPMTLKFNEGHEGQVHVEFDLLSKIWDFDFQFNLKLFQKT